MSRRIPPYLYLEDSGLSSKHSLKDSYPILLYSALISLPCLTRNFNKFLKLNMKFHVWIQFSDYHKRLASTFFPISVKSNKRDVRNECTWMSNYNLVVCLRDEIFPIFLSIRKIHSYTLHRLRPPDVGVFNWNFDLGPSYAYHHCIHCRLTCPRQ